MNPESMWFIERGGFYYIPTIGPAYVGRVAEVSAVAIKLEPGAVWVRQSGNVEDMHRTGSVQEFFTIPETVVIPFSICQPWHTWKHKIPGT